VKVDAATPSNPGLPVGTSSYNFVPSGALMFFNLSACPPGWSILTGAQGRYLVGMPAGATASTNAPYLQLLVCQKN